MKNKIILMTLLASVNLNAEVTDKDKIVLARMANVDEVNCIEMGKSINCLGIRNRGKYEGLKNAQVSVAFVARRSRKSRNGKGFIIIRSK